MDPNQTAPPQPLQSVTPQSIGEIPVSQPTQPPTPPPQPDVPPQPEPEKKGINKTLILILLLVIIAIPSFVYLIILPNTSTKSAEITPVPTITKKSSPTPTPDETANWKTYINAKYGLSIKYPQDWRLDVTVLTEMPVLEGEKDKYPNRIDLRNITGDQDFSTISIDPEGLGSCLNPAMKTAKTDLNGIKVTSNFFINNISHEVFCYTNIDLASLPKLSIGVSYPKKDKELVNQILSTFKFTSASPTGTSQASPTPKDPNLKTFTSQKLGISFDYLEKQAAGYTIKIEEKGNEIIVNSQGSSQSLEVFTKDKNDSLETAIKKQFLANIPPADCFVINTTSNYNKSGYPQSYTIAEISFPKDTSNGEPWWAKATKCPQNYSQSNGISYFLGESKHPDKYLFLSIGQYRIDAGLDKGWQDTIKFLD